MKTRKLSMDLLYRLAYVDGNRYITCEDWIDNHAGDFFKFDVSSCTFAIRRDGSEFEVDARNYRQHTWYMLFYSTSARSVLQDLYDYLFSCCAEPINN